MNKLNLSKVSRNLQNSLDKHSPEILTAIGITGMLSSVVLAVKATPKALSILEEEIILRDGKSTITPDIQYIAKMLPMKDKIKLTWKLYIPATVTATISIACLVGANSVNAKRNAALATAYKITETAFSEYKEKVVETIGEKKEQIVKDKVAKDKIEKNPVSNNEVIITEKGNTLCYDAISGRYFKSDIDKIRRAENVINKRLMNDMYASLNEFYEQIGLPGTTMGEELGWNMDNDMIEIQFGTALAGDGQPCVVIDYSIAPKYNFSRLH